MFQFLGKVAIAPHLCIISCPVEYLRYRWRQGRGQKAEGRRKGKRLQGTRE
ncbi:MAG: hypothetical protein RIE73_01380 [Coleofasciculus sp. C1-SOL-03]